MGTLLGTLRVGQVAELFADHRQNMGRLREPAPTVA